MRRKDREITDFNIMLEAVKEADCVRLGLIDDRGAYIVPLNFGYEAVDGRLILYIHSADAGKKMELIKASPYVSFEIDTNHGLITHATGCRYSYRFKCVMGHGHITILDSDADKRHGFRRIFAHYTDNPDISLELPSINAAAVIKIEVTDWTCKIHD